MSASALPPSGATPPDPSSLRAYPREAYGTLAENQSPSWLLHSFPWLLSLTFHFAAFLLGLFIIYLAYQALNPADEQPIVVPSSFEDPSLSEHPGGIPNPGSGDPSKENAADRLKELAKSEGWSASSNQNVADMLGGQSGDAEVAGIFRGMGGHMGTSGGNATGEAKAGAYGSGGGSGIGPKSSFYGTGGNATRIVYVIDSSGSMLDNFDFLKLEMTKSVNNLVPLQFFNVIFVSDKAAFVGPNTLQRAIPDNKKLFTTALKNTNAEGQNDDLIAPFQTAFEKAFAMKPQLVYFLTDGKFGEGLNRVIANLNKDKKVHINTIAFVTEEPTFKTQLKQLAEENGGVYKFIPEKDLGK